MSESVSFFGTLLNQNYWAMRPEAVERLYPIIKGIMGGNRSSEFSGNKERNQVKYARFDNTKKRSSHLDESDTFRMGTSVKEGDVAVISIIGTMFKRAADMDAVSATAGVSRVTRFIREAADNDDVSGIVLVFDSPGGTVDGTEDLVAAIKDANIKKRVIGFVDGLAASAAFWAISQTDEIIVSGETSEVGSIGVVMQHVNGEMFFANAGLEITFLTNDDATKKVSAPPTRAITVEEKNEIINKSLNPIAKIFQGDVKTGRGDKLREEQRIFSGRVFLFKEAKKLGLVDKIGSLHDAVRSAKRRRNNNSKTSKKSSNKTSKNNNMGIFDGHLNNSATTTEPVELTADQANSLRSTLDTQEKNNIALEATNKLQSGQIESLIEENGTAKAALEIANTNITALEEEVTIATISATDQETKVTGLEEQVVTLTDERDTLQADKENWGDEATVNASKYNALVGKYNALAAKAGEESAEPIDPESDDPGKIGDDDKKSKTRKKRSSLERV